MNRKIKYTEPKLLHYDYNMQKTWRVWFDITNEETGETIRKQVKEGLNRHKKLKDRIAFAHTLIAFWKQQLKDGYNPFHQATEADKIRGMNFNSALDFALKECKLAKNTLNGYNECIGHIKNAATKTGIDKMAVNDVEQTHIKLLLKQCTDDLKWTNMMYNKMLHYLSAVLGRLIEWQIIKFNPASKIKMLATVETEKYVPYTAEEKNKIREYLYLNHYNFYVILMIIYHTGIRPKEVLALQIKDIDLKNRTIFIYPEIEKENSKTKGIRKIPINNHLLPFLRELELHKHNPQLFAFGSPYTNGNGARGTHAGMKGKKWGTMHPDYFKPSSVMTKRGTLTKFWQKIVKDKLGIDKYLYAAKHTGGNEKILAGMDLDILKTLYGHSSKFMTEKYAKIVKDIYRQQIIDNSPDF